LVVINTILYTYYTSRYYLLTLLLLLLFFYTTSFMICYIWGSFCYCLASYIQKTNRVILITAIATSNKTILFPSIIAGLSFCCCSATLLYLNTVPIPVPKRINFDYLLICRAFVSYPLIRAINSSITLYLTESSLSQLGSSCTLLFAVYAECCENLICLSFKYLIRLSRSTVFILCSRFIFNPHSSKSLTITSTGFFHFLTSL
jgi:hypothetical protein